MERLKSLFLCMMDGRLSFIVSLLLSAFLAHVLVGFRMCFICFASGSHVAFDVYFVKLVELPFIF